MKTAEAGASRLRKIKFIALKEIKHIIRDPRSLIISMLMPIVMTFLYGYAINLDIKNIKLAVVDYDKSSESREFIESFYTSGYFIKPEIAVTISNPEEILRASKAAAVMTLSPGFGQAVNNLSNYDIGLLVDGADANTAAALVSYSNIILTQYLSGLIPITASGYEIPGVHISHRVLFNPDLKSSHFFVPGLIAIILMMISALLTSMTIAREKETGTMEQLLTSPVTPRQIIIGKVLPYIGLALIDGFLVLMFALFHFGVPFVGSSLLLFGFGFIYIIAALSIGILISTVAKTQQLAMMYAQVATMLPSVMLSGFIFEIKNMPVFLQGVSHIFPARYFISIIRGVLLKGSELNVLWVEAAFLIALSLMLLIMANKLFKLKIG